MAPSYATVSILFLGLASAAIIRRQNQGQTVIPTTVFDSQSDFEGVFSYNYPWGTDHNGAAQMDQSKVSVSNGVLTLTSTPTSGLGSTSGGIQLDYMSGTVHSTQNLSIATGGGYDFTCDFIAPTAKGTWPAFWLMGANSWPPEVDMAEWKGTGDVSFNTFNTSSDVAAQNFNWPQDGSFHTVKAEIRDEDGSNANINFYLDGALMASQVGSGFTNVPFYFIIDYQMEGSSGSPGPNSETTFQLRNLNVVEYGNGQAPPSTATSGGSGPNQASGGQGAASSPQAYNPASSSMSKYGSSPNMMGYAPSTGSTIGQSQGQGQSQSQGQGASRAGVGSGTGGRKGGGIGGGGGGPGGYSDLEDEITNLMKSYVWDRF